MNKKNDVETMQLQWDSREEDTIKERIDALKSAGWVPKGRPSVYAKMHTTVYFLDLERPKYQQSET